MNSEMNKLLSSFDVYIQSRSSKIMKILPYLTKLSLPSYTIVHTHDQNNIGILFQLLPKVQYVLTTTMDYNAILAVNDYAQKTISSEELRYIDYCTNVKNVTGIMRLENSIKNRSLSPTFNRLSKGTNVLLSINPLCKILHSLPIIYPYSDGNSMNEFRINFLFISSDMVYSQKYPSFWMSNMQRNDNNDALFQTISIEKRTPEFLFVQRLFYKTIPDTQIKIAFVSINLNLHYKRKSMRKIFKDSIRF